jgi:hypothetical protein
MAIQPESNKKSSKEVKKELNFIVLNHATAEQSVYPYTEKGLDDLKEEILYIQSDLDEEFDICLPNGNLEVFVGYEIPFGVKTNPQVEIKLDEPLQ